MTSGKLLKIKQTRKPLSPGILEQAWENVAVKSFDVEHVLSSLNNVLTNGHGLQYFRAFLESEFSVENLDFYLAVQHYKKLKQDSERKKMAYEILENFIRDRAQKQVNVSFSQREEVEENMRGTKGFPLDLFDNIQKSIFSMIESDSFPRFQRHPLYTRLFRRLSQRNFLENLIKRNDRSAHSTSESKLNIKQLQKHSSLDDNCLSDEQSSRKKWGTDDTENSNKSESNENEKLSTRENRGGIENRFEKTTNIIDIPIIDNRKKSYFSRITGARHHSVSQTSMEFPHSAKTSELTISGGKRHPITKLD